MSIFWLNLFVKFSSFIFSLKQKIAITNKWPVMLGYSIILVCAELVFMVISLPIYLMVTPDKLQERGKIFPSRVKDKTQLRVYDIRRKISLLTFFGAGGLFLIKVIFITIVSAYLLGAEPLLAATENWTFDNSADYNFDTAKVEVTGGQVRLKSTNTVYSGTTTNPGFDSDSSGWTYVDWDDGANVDVTGVRQTSGGNPGAYPSIDIEASKKNITGAGYWYQSFTINTTTPATATLSFNWRSISLTTSTLPATYKLYAFVDNNSSVPTVGNAVWNSGEITSTTGWLSPGSINVINRITTTGTYYVKIAAYATSPNTAGTYSYISGFDNIQLNWSKSVITYPSDSPSVMPINSLVPSGVSSWSSFAETATKTGGDIYYQLSSDNGTSWQYWNGSAWTTATATSSANTSTVINSHINTFPVASGQIKWKAFLMSTGTALVALDNIAIGYTQNATPEIQNVSAGQNTTAGYVYITYNLIDGNNDPCSLVNYEYSLTGAFAGEQQTMTPATGDPNHQGVSNLSSSASGVSHTFVWNAAGDLGNIYDATVYVRLRANDGIINSTYATSSAFGVDYVLPVISNLSAAKNVSDDNVVIHYDLFDNTSDNILVELQISSDSGVTWNIPTTSAGGDLGSSITSGNGKTITWISTTDFAGHEENDMRVRMRARDKYKNQGVYFSTIDFILDNKAPIVNTTTNLIAQPNAGDTSVLISGAFAESNPDTNDFYIAINGGGYGNLLSGDSDTATPVAEYVPVGTTLQGDDYISSVKIIHTDDFDHITNNENTSPAASYKYVKPYTPSAPTVSIVASDSIDVTVNKNSSEVDGLEYAIYESHTDQYVQVDNTLGSSPYWRVVTSTVTVTGLSSPLSQYVFQVKSRNISDASHQSSSESAMSSGASSEYQAPSITINSVSQSVDGSKYVTINYTGTDYLNQANDLTVYEYSTDNTTWYTMTEKSGVGSSGITDIPFSASGASLNFAWDTNADLPNTEDTTVYVRLKSNSGSVDSNLAEASVFAIDTKNPVVANQQAGQNSATNVINISYDLTEGSNTDVVFLVSDDNGATWSVNTNTYSGDAGNNLVSGTGKNILWNAGVDFNNQENESMKIKILSVDDFGNIGAEAETNMFSMDTKSPSVSSVSAFQTSGSAFVTVNYNLSDLSSSTVMFDISSDGGVTWTVATTTYAGDVGVGVLAGIKTFTWNAVVDFPDQELVTMRVRVRAVDAFNHASNISESTNFSINTKVLSISDITAEQNLGADTVTIQYDLNKDADIFMDISSDGGATWVVNTSTVTGDVGEGITSGNNHIVTWNAGTDFSNQENNEMRVRFRGVDSTGTTSPYYESVNFSVDTAGPLGLTALSKFSSTETTATLLWQAVSDMSFNRFELWHGISQDNVNNRNGLAEKWSVSDDILLNNPLTVSTVITGLNLTDDYYVKIWAVDDYENESTVSLINVYEEPTVPTSTPTTTPVSTTTMEVGTYSGTVRDVIAPEKPVLNPLNTPTKETMVRISGLAEPGSKLELYDNGYLIGVFKNLADNNGIFVEDWVFDIGTHALFVKAVDTFGNYSPASGVVNLTISPLNTVPNTPIILTPQNNTTFSGDTLRIIGTADANNKIILSIDANEFNLQSDNTGAWSFILPSTFALSEGVHAISALALDQENNQSAKAMVSITKISAGVPVPLATVLVPPASSLIEEAVSAIELPGIPVPTVSVAGTKTAADGEKISFSGTSMPNSDVVVYIHSDQALVYNTRTDSEGNWNIEHSQEVSALSPGTHTIYAVALNTDARVKSKPSIVSGFTVERNFWVMIFQYLNWQTTSITLFVLLLTTLWLYRLRKKEI